MKLKFISFFSFKNNIFQILIVSLLIPFIFIFQRKHVEIQYRNLFSERKMENICAEGDKFFLKYYEDYSYNYYPSIKTKYINYMINYIKDKDSQYIKKYLSRIGVYLFFLSLDFVIIIFWFIYCICCCKPLCNDKNNINNSIISKDSQDEILKEENRNNNKIINESNKNITNSQIKSSSHSTIKNSDNNNNTIDNLYKNSKNDKYKNSIKKKEKHGYVSKISFPFLLILIMNYIIIICIILLLSLGYKLKKEINSTTCSLLYIYTNIIQGETLNKNTPKWEGIENIKNIFITLSNKVEEIGKYYPIINNYYEKIKTEFYVKISNEEFVTNEKKIYDEKFTNNKILNPDIRNNSDLNISVDYYYNLSYNLNLTYNDYLISLSPIEKSLLIFITHLKIINESSFNIKQNILNSIDKLNDIMFTFNDFSDNILEELIKYQNQINKNFNKVFFPIFLLFLFFTLLLSIIGFFLIFKPQISFMKILFHIVLQFQIILTLITFLIGIFLGILSFIGKDFINVFYYATSTENLYNENPIILKGKATKYINSCFNYNSDLSEEIGLNSENSNVDSLSEIYLFDFNFKKQISFLESLTFKTEILYNDFKKNNSDITNVNYYLNDKQYYIQDILNEIRKFTDFSFNNNYILKSNKYKTYHMWVFNIENCEKNYYYTKEINDENEEDKLCFKISDFTNFPRFYSGINCNFSSFSDCQHVFETYFDRLKNYFDKNVDLLGFMVTQYQDYYNNFTDIKSKIIDTLKESQKVTSLLKEIFSNYLNYDNRIFDLLNCKFIKRDVNIFYNEMDKKLTNRALFLSIMILIMSCASMISILLVFIFPIMITEKEIEIKDNNILSKNEFIKPEVIHNNVNQ